MGRSEGISSRGVGAPGPSRAAWLVGGGVCVLLALVLAPVKLGQHSGLRTNDFDTGIYSNLIWNIAHGEGFHSDVLRLNHLGEHFSPIVALLAPLTYGFDAVRVLMVAQALAVALAYGLLVPLVVDVAAPLGRRRAMGIGLGVVAMALLYRPIWSAVWFQFHPSTLGMPLLVGALLAMRRGRIAILLACVAGLLACKELGVLTAASLSLYAGLVLGRWRLAGVLGAIALAAGLIIFLAVIPHFRDDRWGHTGRLAPLMDPGLKARYVLLLAAGLGLLPLLSPRALMCALPLTVLNLSVGFANQYSLDFHYDDQNAVLWVVAAGHGAVKLARGMDGLGRRIGPVSWGIAGLAVVGVGLAAWTWRGRLPHEEWRLRRTGAEHGALLERVERYAQEGREVGIVSQAGLGPHLSQRDRYDMLRRTRPIRTPYRTGDLIIMTDLVGAMRANLDEHRAFLDADPRAERVEHDGIMQVWRWIGADVESDVGGPSMKTDWRRERGE